MSTYRVHALCLAVKLQNQITMLPYGCSHGHGRLARTHHLHGVLNAMLLAEVGMRRGSRGGSPGRIGLVPKDIFLAANRARTFKTEGLLGTCPEVRSDMYCLGSSRCLGANMEPGEGGDERRGLGKSVTFQTLFGHGGRWVCLMH